METHNTTKNENNNEDKVSIAALIGDTKSEEQSNSSVFVEEEDNEKSVPGVKKSIEKSLSRKKYHNIPNEMRLKLIEFVENKGEKIKHAAKKFGINYSSAKSICQVFKKEGRTNKKTFKRRSGREDISNKDKIEHIDDQFADTQLTFNEIHPEGNGRNEIPAKEDEKNNSLLALRDRLLESKIKKSQDQSLDQQFKTPEEFADAINQESNLTQHIGIKQLQQIDKVIAQNNQILTLSQPQQKNPFLITQPIRQQPPQILIIPQQPSSQMFFNPTQNFPNFMGHMQQTITPTHGPVQTININQPQTKVLNISSNPQSEQQTILQTNMNNIQAIHYADPTAMPIQQHNSYMIINPNMQQQQQQQQFGGYQIMQPVYYMVPQNPVTYPNLQYIAPQELSYALPQQQNVMIMSYPQHQDQFKVKNPGEFTNTNLISNLNGLANLEAKFKNEDIIPIIKEDEKA